MNEKISSLGFHRKGKEFMEAAFAVKEPDGSNPLLDSAPFVAYYLLGHAMELYLKSFLIGRGMTEKELRFKPYGHDLRELLIEARRRKLGRELKLSNRDLNVVCLLNSHYKPKHLEYYAKGLYSFPPYSIIADVVKRSCNSVHTYASQVTDSEFQKTQKRRYNQSE